MNSRLVCEIYPEVRREQSAVLVHTFDVPFDTPLRCRERASYFAMTFYTICSILAAWLSRVRAALVTVAWAVWVFYPLDLKKNCAR